MKQPIDFEAITLRSTITTRGGGMEIDLSTLGFPGEKMTAYQNYLGGGMLGRVCSDCTIPKDKFTDDLRAIEDALKRHFFLLTNPDEDAWESVSYDQNQTMMESAY